MSMNQPMPRKRSISLRTIVILVLLVLMVLFCGFNRTSVTVVPFGNAPLIVVMVICFGLGLGIGWLLRSVMHGGNNLAPDDMRRMNVDR